MGIISEDQMDGLTTTKEFGETAARLSVGNNAQAGDKKARDTRGKDVAYYVEVENPRFFREMK